MFTPIVRFLDLLSNLQHQLPGYLKRFWAGLIIGSSLTLSTTGFALYYRNQWKQRISRELPKRAIQIRKNDVVKGIQDLVGNTPLIRINSLSDLTGVEILGKAEYMNPGGSVKDRVALRIIQKAEIDGLLYPHTNSTIFEGTSGSTGISIATLAPSLGYKSYIVLPDDTAAEKVQLLETLGATVEKVRPVGIANQGHYVNVARRRALEFGKTELVGPDGPAVAHDGAEFDTRDDLVVTTTASEEEQKFQGFKWQDSADKPRGLFADQFENLANFEAHLLGTGPEIWDQTNGIIDAFVAGAGTGGTISGVATYLKSKNPSIKAVVADCQGSGLYHKIKHGVMYSPLEAEGTRRRHQVDTLVEGIGLNRITQNFAQGEPMIDDAIRVTDDEAISMSRHILKHDGLFLGSSSAVNLVACVKMSKTLSKMPTMPGTRRTIVTILCDSGSRHYSKFWNAAVVEAYDVVSIESMLK